MASAAKRSQASPHAATIAKFTPRDRSELNTGTGGTMPGDDIQPAHRVPRLTPSTASLGSGTHGHTVNDW